MSFLTSTTPTPLTQDVEPGIGTTKSASPAQTTGSSMLTKSVFQFLTIVLPMMLQELASLATRVMTLKKENVSSPIQTTPNHLIQDALPGIGTTKSASPAQTNGSSMLTKSVCQFLTNVLLMMLQEPA